MPAVSTNDLKNGMSLNLPEGLFSVVEFQHVKPGKGGAFVRTKLKNVRTGAVLERTYRADEKLDQLSRELSKQSLGPIDGILNELVSRLACGVSATISSLQQAVSDQPLMSLILAAQTGYLVARFGRRHPRS